MLVTLLCDRVMQDTSAVPFFCMWTVKTSWQLNMSFSSSLNQSIKWQSLSLADLFLCMNFFIAVLQWGRLTKTQTVVGAIVLVGIIEPAHLLLWKCLKTKKKKKSKLPTLPPAPASPTTQDHICSPLFEDELCQKQWHQAERVLHLQIKGSGS